MRKRNQTEKYERANEKKKITRLERETHTLDVWAVWVSVQLMTESVRDNIDSRLNTRCVSRGKKILSRFFFVFRSIVRESGKEIWKLAKIKLKIILRFDTPEWRKKLAETWFFISKISSRERERGRRRNSRNHNRVGLASCGSKEISASVA